MQGCTVSPQLCSIVGWFAAHPLVSWPLVVLAGLGLLAEFVWIVRLIIQNWKLDQEHLRRREEGEREWKMLRHRIRSTIRQGEEWDVDVTALKTMARRLDLMRKVNRAINYEKALACLPAPILFIELIVLSIFPVPWFAIVTGVCFVLALLWSGYHLWKWYRFERFFRILERIEINS